MYIFGFKRLQRITGLSRSTLNRMVLAKTFPAPRKFGVRSVGFEEGAVKKWIEERTSARLRAAVAKVI
jgi:predicted DNA-binding transcriptional regulator AlpA